MILARVGAGGNPLRSTHTPKARLTRVNGISILIRNLNAELLLNRHHYLHGVEAVQTQVVGKVSSGLDLFVGNIIRQCLARVCPYRQRALGGRV